MTESIPTKYYVSQDGSFIGGFAGCLPEDTSAVEVPTAPTDTRQKWFSGGWLPVANPLVYAERRASEYPAIGDQMDAILKYLDTLPDLPAELRGIIDQWKAVKVRNPKQ